ncbi:MAG: thiamine phosphate synthase [Candidatus Brocadiia bacterium]
MTERLHQMRLYALLTERHCRLPWRETARRLLDGGVDVLQLREKELSDRELLSRACILRELTEDAGALLIVNDRPDVAIISQSHGVHLGQDDLPSEPVRHLIRPQMLLGVSTHSTEQAEEAVAQGADYIGVGPFAATTTKDYSEGKGPALVRRVRACVELPIVAIGGITSANAGEAVRAGATAVAACAALCGAEDPEAAARELRAAVEQAHKGDNAHE